MKTCKDLLTHDVWLALLNHCANPNQKKALTFFCRSFLMQVNTEDWKAFSKTSEVPTELFAIFEQTASWCKAVCALFEVEVPGVDCSAADLLNWTQSKSKGRDTWQIAFKSMLTQDEPAEGAKGEDGKVRAESRSMLQSLVSDTVKTAASSVEYLPKMKEADSALFGMSMELEDGGLKPGLLEHKLHSITSILPDLRKNLRAGATKELEKSLKNFLVMVASKVASSKAPEIHSEDLHVLMEGLKCFNRDAQCCEKQSLLIEWAGRHNATLHLLSVIFNRQITSKIGCLHFGDIQSSSIMEQLAGCWRRCFRF